MVNDLQEVHNSTFWTRDESYRVSYFHHSPAKRPPCYMNKLSINPLSQRLDNSSDLWWLLRRWCWVEDSNSYNWTSPEVSKFIKDIYHLYCIGRFIPIETRKGRTKGGSRHQILSVQFRLKSFPSSNEGRKLLLKKKNYSFSSSSISQAFCFQETIQFEIWRTCCVCREQNGQWEERRLWKEGNRSKRNSNIQPRDQLVRSQRFIIQLKLGVRRWQSSWPAKHTRQAQMIVIMKRFSENQGQHEPGQRTGQAKVWLNSIG